MLRAKVQLLREILGLRERESVCVGVCVRERERERERMRVKVACFRAIRRNVTSLFLLFLMQRQKTVA